MGKLKTVFKFFSVLILIGLLLIAVLLLVIEFNKPAIISKVESWYAENHQGELKINDFDFQILSSFPDLSFKIDQVQISEYSFSRRNHRKLSAETIAFYVPLENYFPEN